jgi:hypothetical protein
LARDFIGIPELESFIAGHRELSPPQLDLLAGFLFDASYDADRAPPALAEADRRL